MVIFFPCSHKQLLIHFVIGIVVVVENVVLDFSELGTVEMSVVLCCGFGMASVTDTLESLGVLCCASHPGDRSHFADTAASVMHPRVFGSTFSWLMLTSGFLLRNWPLQAQVEPASFYFSLFMEYSDCT